MNRNHHNPAPLSDDERRLLGDAAAELLRDERWLAARMDHIHVPHAVRTRLSAAARAELGQPSHRRRLPRLAAMAAGLVLAAGSVFVWSLMQQNATRGATETVAAAQTIEAYVSAVDDRDIQMHNDLKNLGGQVADSACNPWMELSQEVDLPRP